MVKINGDKSKGKEMNPDSYYLF